MNIKPYGQHLYIKVLEVDDQDFKMSGEDADKPIRGEVLAIGELKNNTIGIKVGDIVIYDYYSSVEYHQMDQEYLIIHEDEILGKEIKEKTDGN